MQLRLIALFAVLLALALAGCEQQPNASAGAAPPMSVVVGPVPGIGSPPQGQADPYANDVLGMAQGRKLFVWYNCYSCHGGHGGGGMGPSLRDRVWIYGSSDAQVFHSIAEGRGKGMPAWGLKIPQSQIWELVAYIKSMRTPQEPEPPR